MTLPEALRRAAPERPEAPTKLINPWDLAKAGTEHAEQTALFAWAATAARYGIARANDPATYSVGMVLWPLDAPGKLRKLYSIPNGGLRDKITASNLKAEGAKSGVPDIHFPVSRHGYLSLYIEMKRIKYKPKHVNGMGGRSHEQIAWGIDLTEEGNFVATCYGFEEARQCLIWYLDGRE
jgi:hypothetical protein